MLLMRQENIENSKNVSLMYTTEDGKILQTGPTYQFVFTGQPVFLL